MIDAEISQKSNGKMSQYDISDSKIDHVPSAHTIVILIHFRIPFYLSVQQLSVKIANNISKSGLTVATVQVLKSKR